MKKYLILILFVLFLKSSVLASTGCLKGGLVYINPPSGWNQWTNSIDDSCPSGASVSDTYAFLNSVSVTSCSVGFLGWSGSGVIVDYSIMNCPLDDYVPVAVLFVAGFSFFYLRAKKIAV